MSKDLFGSFFDERATNYLSSFLFSITNLLILGFFLIFIPEIINQIKQFDPELSKFYEYSIYGATILASGVFRIPFGILVDYFGYKIVSLILHISVTLGLTLLYLFTPKSYIFYLFTSFLIGVGGNIFVITFTQARDIFSYKHEGTVLGNINIASIAVILIFVLREPILNMFSLQALLGDGIVLSAVSFILFSIFGNDKDNAENIERRKLLQPKNVNALRPCKDTRFLFFSYFYAMTFGGVLLISFFAEQYFKDIFFVELESFNLVSSQFVSYAFLFGVLFIPLGGFLADKYKSINVLYFLFLIITIASFGIGLSYNFSFYFSAIGFLIIVFGLSTSIGSIFSLISEKTNEKFATMLGLVGTLGTIFIVIIFGIMYEILELTNEYMFVFILFGSSIYSAFGFLQVKKREWLIISPEEIEAKKQLKLQRLIAKEEKRKEKEKKHKRKIKLLEIESKKSQFRNLIAGGEKNAIDPQEEERDLFFQINKNNILAEREKREAFEKRRIVIGENANKIREQEELEKEPRCDIVKGEVCDSEITTEPKATNLEEKLSKIEQMEKELAELKKSLISKA